MVFNQNGMRFASAIQKTRWGEMLEEFRLNLDAADIFWTFELLNLMFFLLVVYNIGKFWLFLEISYYDLIIEISIISSY
jgi:hypothetical protein